jgi:hypothetical protein
LPLLAVVAGCGKAPHTGVYDLPVATVFERISTSDMDDFRAARQCGLLIHFTVEKRANEEVRWVVRSSGSEVASFTARLVPLAADKTKVEIELPKAPDGGEIYDGTKFYPRPALYQPLRPAIAELIDARIEQRPFDVWRIPDGVRAKDSVCSVQRAGLEGGNAHFRHDGKDEQGSAWRHGKTGDAKGAPKFAPGQPMIDPVPSR